MWSFQAVFTSSQIVNTWSLHASLSPSHPRDAEAPGRSTHVVIPVVEKGLVIGVPGTGQPPPDPFHIDAIPGAQVSVQQGVHRMGMPPVYKGFLLFSRKMVLIILPLRPSNSAPALPGQV